MTGPVIPQSEMNTTARIEVHSPTSDFLVDNHLRRNDEAVADLMDQGVDAADAAAAVVTSRVLPNLEGPARTLLRTLNVVCDAAPVTPDVLNASVAILLAEDGVEEEEEWKRLARGAKWCNSMIDAYFMARTNKEQAEGRAAEHERRKRSRKPESPERVAAKEQRAREEEQRKTAALALDEQSIGDDIAKGPALAALPINYSLFIRLNARGPMGSLVREAYVPQPVVVRSEFDAACKVQCPDIAAMKNHVYRCIRLKQMWDARRARKMDWCIGFGRIPDYATFITVNQSILKDSKLRQGELWTRYNNTWDALCGLQLFKPRTPRSNSNTAAKGADDDEEEEELPKKKKEVASKKKEDKKKKRRVVPAPRESSSSSSSEEEEEAAAAASASASDSE